MQGVIRTKIRTANVGVILNGSVWGPMDSVHGVSGVKDLLLLFKNILPHE